MSAVQGHWREVSEQTLAATITNKSYFCAPPKASSQVVIIVERKEDWASYFPSEDIVTAQEYLEQTRENESGKRVQVINLCRSYKYLGHGYYCSLLAEARGHKVIPSVRTSRRRWVQPCVTAQTSAWLSNCLPSPRPRACSAMAMEYRRANTLPRRNSTRA